MHYRRYLASPEAIPIDSDPFGEILRAAELANYAARKGFVSSAVVLAGFAFYCLLKQLGFKLEDISRFRPLWGALEEYMKTCELMRLSSPHHPQVPGICAARRCGEKTLKDSFTRRVNRQRDGADCGFYCSVECQDQVRLICCMFSGELCVDILLTGLAPAPTRCNHYDTSEGVLSHRSACFYGSTPLDGCASAFARFDCSGGASLTRREPSG